MLNVGTDMFVFIPGESNERILHAGKVVEGGAGQLVAQFEEGICPEVGSEVIVYFEMRGKFFQQGAKVTESMATTPKPTFVFSRSGEPVSAESRQTFRVATVTSGIFAKIGHQKSCPITDISPEGFSAIVAGELKLGSLVPVEFRYESHSVNALARVQGIKNLPSGKIRYGFLAPEKTSPARKALQLITTSLQRDQLRRLSGAA